MKKIILMAFAMSCFAMSAQVGIGTTSPATDAILDLTATNKALLIPRVATTAAINNPINGMLIYDISSQCVKAFENDLWSNCFSAQAAVIGALNCNLATTAGLLTINSPAIAVSATVPYTGGNGGIYSSQAITSTGVLGLTASLISGSLVNGDGSLNFAISGTPTSSGTALFDITFGGKSCVLELFVDSFPVGTVHCVNPTVVNEVISPLTSRIWMDRNLGASRVATSITDTEAYGDLYQWGRFTDGHQCRNSALTTTLSSSDQPGHGDYIRISPQTPPNDWRDGGNDNLWQGITGVNNPCPEGFRIPTESEFNAERPGVFIPGNDIFQSGFDSFLKLTPAGGRGGSGNIGNIGTAGVYWTSDISLTTNASALFFEGSGSGFTAYFRVTGFSIRCIKE